MLRFITCLVLVLLATPAVADEAFNQRQNYCNTARDDLAIYVTRASGYTITQDSQNGDGRLTQSETSSLNHQYYLATEPLSWELRDAAFVGDIEHCRLLKERGIDRVNRILMRAFGKVDASISSRN